MTSVLKLQMKMVALFALRSQASVCPGTFIIFSKWWDTSCLHFASAPVCGTIYFCGPPPATCRADTLASLAV